MVAMATASAILGVTVTSSIALQRSFNSTDNYLATHTQQIRIVDFLARDVRRGLSVVSSVDEQTVQIQIPKYIIQAGDPEAILNPLLIGTPRSPSRAIVSRDYNMNYGAAAPSFEARARLAPRRGAGPEAGDPQPHATHRDRSTSCRTTG